jgi:hypothetical protein
MIFFWIFDIFHINVALCHSNKSRHDDFNNRIISQKVKNESDSNEKPSSNSEYISEKVDQSFEGKMKSMHKIIDNSYFARVKIQQ